MLDQQFAQGVQSCPQNRPMKSARDLWLKAQADHLLFPVVFLDASQGGIVYWGVIDKIEITGDSTNLSYMLMKPLSRLPHSELIVQSTRKPLHKDFIRSYAICDTPSFVH
jgi:hypothetical protein